MDFHGFGEFPTSVNHGLGEKTVAVVALPVCHQKGVLRELGAPCEDSGNECWMKRVILLVG